MSSAAARLASRVPLPQGTIAIGAGLVLAGLTQYGFLAVASHALGPTRYAPLATFWALLFVLAPGVFLPLEQEVGRALAARRARGEGGRPLVLRAAAAGVSLALLLALLAVALQGVFADRAFHGDRLFVWALAVGLLVFAVQFVARGTFAGNGRFGPYGLLLGLEGVLRVGFCVLLAVGMVGTSGWFGVALVGGSVIAVAVAGVGRRNLITPGPHAAWSELSNALGFLLLASLMTQFLLSVGTVVVQLLAAPGQQAAPGRFLDSRIVAYVPIFLFQAVQAALLPRLAGLAARGRHIEYRRVLAELLLLVAGLGVAATVALTLLGPLVAQLLFGSAFALGHLDFALLALSGAAFMVAQLLSQALISLTGYARAAVAWTSGGVIFIAVTAAVSDLFLRVELGMLAGSLATAVVMAALLVPLLRAHGAEPEGAELLAAATPVAET